MSFALTTNQIRNHSKTVTRRLGWATLKSGATLKAVERAMGLRKGEHPVELGLIRVVSVRREPLNAIDTEDCRREGFPEMEPAAFVAMFCGHMKVMPETEVNRIEFEYIDGGID